MKPVIIAIVGPSGSGKTTMAEYLKKYYGIQTIVSYTTRPIREGEQQGREHQFVTEDAMPTKNEMMAYTQFGGYHYWATHAQARENGICTYVIDEKGLIMLAEQYATQYQLYPILIKMDAQKLQASPERIARDNDRIQLNDAWYQQIIYNNGTIEEFWEQIETIFDELIESNPLFTSLKNR